MIEHKYEPQARIAADALRDALIAVEACGADEELTKIVGNLATDRTRLCNLFGLDTVQVHQAPGPGRTWSPEHRAYVTAERGHETVPLRTRLAELIEDATPEPGYVWTDYLRPLLDHPRSS